MADFVHVETQFDYSRIDGLIEFVGDFSDEVRTVAKREFNARIRIGFLSSLRTTPKRRYWDKTDFVSPASRRAFFAKTHGKAYQRTGTLAKSWRTFIEETDTSVAFGAENTAPYHKWVEGSLQQKGHARTGWKKSDDRFEEWRPRTVDVIVKAVGQLIADKVG